MLPTLKTQSMKFGTTSESQRADTPTGTPSGNTQMTRLPSQTTGGPSQNTNESTENPNNLIHLPKGDPPIGQTQTSTETTYRPTPTGRERTVITSTQSQWTNVAPQSMYQKMEKPEDMDMWL
ncbi:hypothetical protein MMC18_001507 [Xylographa bjoerkii]|nr:hypothetical protein [Xylographa bjoerkii]